MAAKLAGTLPRSVSLRYAAALLPALLVTYLLYLVMREMTTAEPAQLEPEATVRTIDFVRLRREPRVEPKPQRMPQKPQAVQHPAMPTVALPTPTALRNGTGPAVPRGAPVEIPEVGLNLVSGPQRPVVRDAEAVALFRVQPDYPRSAAERGVEGWVRVRFTVSATGSVEEPEVIAAEPPGLFDRAALAAIRRWRYRPRVRGGRPVPRRGVTVRLTFQLDQQEGDRQE